MVRHGELDSVKKGRWSAFNLNSWPSDLPLGHGGEWQGWSMPPRAESEEWPEEQRHVVKRVLEAQYRKAGLTPPDQLSLLDQRDCRAVVAGHQLVVGGGAAFFHHKILSAIRVSRQLTQSMGKPVVPVFWMASEDHDWQEISTVHGTEREHAWTPKDIEHPVPVGQLPLDGMQDVLLTWAEDGVASAVSDGMLEDLTKARENGETLSGAMRRWLHRWYGECGLLVLDPDDAALKALASHLWSAEFEGAGIHSVLAGVAPKKGEAHVRENSVFWLDDEAGRIGVVRDNGDGSWRAGNKVLNRTGEDWPSWCAENAKQCSPGVLLRPLYQETLLHSLAVVVGPGEWKYWNQIQRTFVHHNIPFPPLRLRDHGVVISEEAARLGWSLETGWLHDEAWDRWVLDRWVDALGEAVPQHESRLSDWHDALEQWSKEDMGGTLDGPSGALRAATTKAWNQWKAKLRKSLKGTRSQEWTAARRACASLVRGGKPQDRWANWHVLAGENHDRWRQEWLKEECGLAAQVWCFSPDQEWMNR